MKEKEAKEKEGKEKEAKEKEVEEKKSEEKEAKEKEAEEKKAKEKEKEKKTEENKEEKAEKGEEKPYWEGKNYSYFSHRDCEYFPCHPGAREEDFSCLFCYCPLYALGRDCGGHFRYTEKGFKDCTGCLLPHLRKNYGYVIGRYQDLARRMEEFEKLKKDGEAPGKSQGRS